MSNLSLKVDYVLRFRDSVYRAYLSLQMCYPPHNVLKMYRVIPQCFLILIMLMYCTGSVRILTILDKYNVLWINMARRRWLHFTWFVYKMYYILKIVSH